MNTRRSGVPTPQRQALGHFSLLLWALVCAALAVFWWLRAQPTPLAAMPETVGKTAPLDCLSYSPFRLPGVNPFIPSRAVDAAQIQAAS